jgi:hypothetical protein
VVNKCASLTEVSGNIQAENIRHKLNIPKLQNKELLYAAPVHTASCTNLYETPWPESASELHRQSDNRLSAKLMLTIAEHGVAWSELRIPRPYSSLSRPKNLYN